MFKPKTKALQTILTISLLLTACGTKSTATPTVDPNVIFTAAAQTVEAQLTQAAASNPAPSETPAAAPTDAPQPVDQGTAAPADQGTSNPGVPPGATLPVLAPATPQGSTPQPASSLPALPGLPTAAATNGPVLPTSTLGPSADKCEYQSQDPLDGTSVDKNVTFDQVWVLKNIGTTTWKKSTYMVRFYSGDRMGSGQRNDYPFRNDVKPGESYKAVADMEPNKSGKKTGTWTLWNGERNFCVFTVTLNVSD
jgi:hypothetical protein